MYCKKFGENFVLAKNYRVIKYYIKNFERILYWEKITEWKVQYKKFGENFLP